MSWPHKATKNMFVFKNAIKFNNIEGNSDRFFLQTLNFKNPFL